MKYTVCFYDTFDRTLARAVVRAENEITAIQDAAKLCNAKLSDVGRIELTSDDWEFVNE